MIEMKRLLYFDVETSGLKSSGRPTRLKNDIPFSSTVQINERKQWQWTVLFTSNKKLKFLSVNTQSFSFNPITYGGSDQR